MCNLESYFQMRKLEPKKTVVKVQGWLSTIGNNSNWYSRCFREQRVWSRRTKLKPQLYYWPVSLRCLVSEMVDITSSTSWSYWGCIGKSVYSSNCWQSANSASHGVTLTTTTRMALTLITLAVTTTVYSKGFPALKKDTQNVLTELSQSTCCMKFASTYDIKIHNITMDEGVLYFFTHNL